MESINKLLCFLSFYINFISSDFCSYRSFLLVLRWWKHLVWLNAYYGRLFDEMRLVTIGLAINLTFIALIGLEAIYFTQKLHAWVIGRAIKTCYYSHRSYFYKFNLSPTLFILIINCVLGFTIHLGLDTIITTRPSSHYSKFICHFRIATLSKKIVFQ